MNILVTGGAGYIGTSLVHKLDKREEVDKILVLDNLSRGENNFFFKHNGGLNKVELIQADILDTWTLKNSLEGIDVVYHLAAKVTTPFSDQDPHLFEQVNQWGTANLVLALEDSDVSRFIYLSSTSVYGLSKETADETTSPEPQTHYGISKLKGEGQAQTLQNKMDTYIVRSGNVYGYNPSVRFDAVINKFMFEANFYNKIAIHGTGEQTRAFIHIKQISDVLSSFLTDNVPPDTYNVVSDNRSVLDVADTVKSLYPELEMTFVSRNLQRRRIKVNTDLKLDEYIQMPTVDFKEALTDFKEHFVY